MAKIKPYYIVFLAALAFYLLLPNQDQGFDSYSYALDIRNGVELFHPHHLLYNYIGHLLYQAFGFTGIGSLELMSLFNSLLAAIAIAIIFSILRRRLSTAGAIIGSATIGLLYSFWYYATSLEVNMPAILLLMLSLYFILIKPPKTINSIMIFLFLAIGTLFHQIIVLAFVPIIIYEINRYQSIKKPIIYAIPGAAIVVIVYLAIGLSQVPQKTIGGFYYWLTFYSHLGAWGKLLASNVLTGIWGLTKTLLGGETVREIVYGNTLSIGQIIYIAIAIAFISCLIAAIIRTIKHGFKQYNAQSWLMLSLIGIFGLFALWWAPSDDGFWFYAVLILFLFVFYMNKKIGKLSIEILALLAISNITYEMWPAAVKDNSIVLQGTQSLQKLNIASDDLVLTNFIQIRLALDYYYGLKVKTASLVYSGPGNSDQIAVEMYQKIEQAQKTGKVFVFANELNPEPHRRYLFERFSMADYQNIYKPYAPFLEKADSILAYGKQVIIYRLTNADSPAVGTLLH